MVEACAGLKTFKRKDGSDQEPPDDPGNPTVIAADQTDADWYSA